MKLNLNSSSENLSTEALKWMSEWKAINWNQLHLMRYSSYPIHRAASRIALLSSLELYKIAAMELA